MKPVAVNSPEPDVADLYLTLRLRELARRVRVIADALADGDHEFAGQLAELLERDARRWARAAAERR